MGQNHENRMELVRPECRACGHKWTTQKRNYEANKKIVVCAKCNSSRLAVK